MGKGAAEKKGDAKKSGKQQKYEYALSASAYQLVEADSSNCSDLNGRQFIRLVHDENRILFSRIQL